MLSHETVTPVPGRSGLPDPRGADPGTLAVVVSAAAEVVRGRVASRALATRLRQAEERIAALNRIGIALSAERDLERLLETILTESRRVPGSEAGSSTSLEAAEGGQAGTCASSSRRTTPSPSRSHERTVPLDEGSLAGWVAVHGVPLVLEDAYAIPKDVPYRHNDAFDVATGSGRAPMLVVPMKDHRATSSASSSS